VARLATIRQKLVASGLNLVALATPQVATSSPNIIIQWRIQGEGPPPLILGKKKEWITEGKKASRTRSTAWSCYIIRQKFRIFGVWTLLCTIMLMYWACVVWPRQRKKETWPFCLSPELPNRKAPLIYYHHTNVVYAICLDEYFARTRNRRS